MANHQIIKEQNKKRSKEQRNCKNAIKQLNQQRPSPVAGDGDKGADAEGLPQVPGTFCLVRKGVGLG